MRKQWHNLLLAIALIGILAACRTAPTPEPAAETPQEEPAATTEATGEEATPAAPEEDAEEGESEEESAAGEEAEPETIRVAFLGPLTGGAAFIGQEQIGFVRAVAALYSEDLGVDIVVEEGDTEINPDTGRIVAERIAANDSIVGAVGPAGSQVCEATLSIFAEAGLAHITPACTSIGLTDPGTEAFFRPIPTDADQSRTIAGYMVNELEVSSAYLVDDQSSYSVGLVDELEEHLNDAGITDVERASVTQDETDFSSIVTSIIAAGSDIVFFPAQIEGQFATLAIQLQEQGYEGHYFVPDGGFSLNWVESAGEAAEGTYVTFFSPDPNLVPEAAEMNAKYTELTGAESFGAFGGASGLSAQILMEAIASCLESGEVTRSCVLSAVDATDLENTVLGIPISFGEGNQAEGNFSIFQVVDGQFILLEQ